MTSSGKEVKRDKTTPPTKLLFHFHLIAKILINLTLINAKLMMRKENRANHNIIWGPFHQLLLKGIPPNLFIIFISFYLNMINPNFFQKASPNLKKLVNQIELVFSNK